VQKYIELFGGDPDQVTAIGESAGGGSIMHHLTAYGGARDPAPISKAIIQSPAFVQRPYKSQGDDSYKILLAAAAVSNLAGLKALSTFDLQVANKLSQKADIYGNFQFGNILLSATSRDSRLTRTIGPGLDGDYVPDLPGTLVSQGKFNKIPVLTAHNTFEANRYTDPAATNSSAFETYMKLYFPEISRVQLLELSALYPAIYTGLYPYSTPFERLRLALSELTFTCNAYFMATALGPALLRKSFSYLFSVGTGYHTIDVPYTYYTSDTSAVANTTLAKMLQGYLTSFAQNGDPNKAGLPAFPVYGLTSTQRNLNLTDTGVIKDPSATLRCAFWQTFK
jgi:carboxylesterase type B